GVRCGAAVTPAAARTRRGILAVLAFQTIWFTGFFPPHNNPNEVSRFEAVVAFVESGTFSIDDTARPVRGPQGKAGLERSHLLQQGSWLDLRGDSRLSALARFLRRAPRRFFPPVSADSYSDGQPAFLLRPRTILKKTGETGAGGFWNRRLCRRVRNAASLFLPFLLLPPLYRRLAFSLLGSRPRERGEPSPPLLPPPARRRTGRELGGDFGISRGARRGASLRARGRGRRPG